MRWELRAEVEDAVMVNCGGPCVVAKIGADRVLLDADTFRLLMRPVAGVSPAEHPAIKALGPEDAIVLTTKRPSVKRAEKKVEAPAASEPKAAEASVSGSPQAVNSPWLEAIYISVDEKPRTIAETVDRVCALTGNDEHDAKIRAAIAAAIRYQMTTGKLVKRDDAQNLPGLYRAVVK